MNASVKEQFMSSDTELLNAAANNKSNSQPENEEWQIEGSPFRIVREDGKCFAAWGNGKMTQDFDTPEEVNEWIDNNYWNFLITVLTMTMDSRDLYKMDQIMKRAKKEGVAEMAKNQSERTLHEEIERLKTEERKTFKIGNMEFIKEQ